MSDKVKKQRLNFKEILNPHILPDRSPRDEMVTSVRAAVADGTLKPGSRIRQQDLADAFGVSRMPAREALRTLAAEGILVNAQRQGYYVRKPVSVEQTNLDTLFQMMRSHYLKLEGEVERQSFQERYHLEVLSGVEHDLTKSSCQ